MGKLVVGNDLAKEVEGVTQGSRQRKSYVEEGGPPLASREIGERQRKEDSDYERSGYVTHDEQRHQQDAQRNAKCEEDGSVQWRADQSFLVLTCTPATLFTGPRRKSILRSWPPRRASGCPVTRCKSQNTKLSEIRLHGA